MQLVEAGGLPPQSVVTFGPDLNATDGVSILLRQHQAFAEHANRLLCIASGQVDTNDDELEQLAMFLSTTARWHCNDELVLLVPLLLRRTGRQERACLLAPRDDHEELDDRVAACLEDIAALRGGDHRPGMRGRASALSRAFSKHVELDEERLYRLARGLAHPDRAHLADAMRALLTARLAPLRGGASLFAREGLRSPSLP